MGALRELIASFGVSFDKEGIEKGEKAVEGFKGKLEAAGKIIAEVFAVHEVKEFIEGQVEAGAQLKISAERLGTTTDELQAMQLAAGEAGVSSESLTTSLRFLNRNISEALKGSGDGAQMFREMGISLKEADGSTRAAGDVLGDLADHLAEMPDAAKKTQIAMKLLGRGGAELIPLLNRGGEAFEEARKSMQELGGGMSGEFVEAAHKAEEAQVRLNFSLTSLKSKLAAELFPVFQKAITWLTDVSVGVINFTKQTNVLTTGLEFLGAVAAVKAIGSRKEIAHVLGILKPSIGQTVIALLEFAAPILIIAALYFAFDELWTLMHGGESVIGDLLEKMDGIGGAAQDVDDISDGLELMKEILPDIGNAIVQQIVLPFKLAWDVVVGLGKAIKDTVLMGATGSGAKNKDNVSQGNQLSTDLFDTFNKLREDSRGAGDANRKLAGHTPTDFYNRRMKGLRPGDENFTGPVDPNDYRAQRNIRARERIKAAEPWTGMGGTAVEGPWRAGPSTGYVAAPPYAGTMARQEPPANVTQTYRTEVNFHGDTPEPDKVKEVVEGAVSTQGQRNRARAMTAGAKP